MAATGMTISVRVDDEAVMRGLRDQRRGINQDVKATTLEAARREVLPSARRMAPRIISRGLIVRSTTRGAYLTSGLRGRWRKVTGLLNFGGTVKREIVPVNAKAMKFNGRYVSKVAGPRTYKGKAFMERSVEQNLGRFCASVEREMARRMQSRIAYAGTFG